jgi:hypothetical protein
MKKGNLFWAGMAAAGVIFALSAVYNRSLWFDESYTVGLIRQDWPGLIRAASDDVHPLLYYGMLKGFTQVFGESLPVLRLFSLIPVFLLALIGGKQIRKVAGEETGRWFVFLLAVMPAVFHYGTQIRMYSWALFFVSCEALLAWQIGGAKGRTGAIQWVGMGLFGVLAAYTHYFALIAAAAVEACLFLDLLIAKKKEAWLVILTAVCQCLAYLPGFLLLFHQMQRVSGGFWITIAYPDIFWQIPAFFWGDSLSEGVGRMAGIFVLAGTVLGLMTAADGEKGIRASWWSLAAVAVTAGTGLLASAWRPVFLARYLFPLAAALLFPTAVCCGRVRGRWRYCLIGFFCLLGVWNMQEYSRSFLDPGNGRWQTYLAGGWEEGDYLLYTDINLGGIAAVTLPEHPQIFYNADGWELGNSYDAFAPAMEILDSVEEVEEKGGRIWVLDGEGDRTGAKLREAGAVCIKEASPFYHPYSGETFWISLYVFPGSGENVL